jgi:hypothetical protein
LKNYVSAFELTLLSTDNNSLQNSALIIQHSDRSYNVPEYYMKGKNGGEQFIIQQTNSTGEN